MVFLNWDFLVVSKCYVIWFLDWFLFVCGFNIMNIDLKGFVVVGDGDFFGVWMIINWY